MTKNFPYKRIISYGCSLTAGSELTDHEFLGITEDELFDLVKKRNMKGSHEVFQFFKLTSMTHKQLLAKNASVSWPNYVAQNFNVPLVNKAMPGTSLSHATYNILNDLHYNAIEEDDLVLVGITSPSRWFQFTDKGEEFGGVFGFLGKDEYVKQLELEWANPYNLMYTHYKEIAFLSDLSDRLNGQIKLCYAFGSPDYLKHFYRSELKEKKFSEFYQFALSLYPRHNFIDHTTSISELASWIEPTKHHVFGHPRVQFHKIFANMISENLEKMYND